MSHRAWWRLKGRVGTVPPRGRGAPGGDHQHGTKAAAGLSPRGPPPYLQAGEEPAVLRQPGVHGGQQPLVAAVPQHRRRLPRRRQRQQQQRGPRRGPAVHAGAAGVGGRGGRRPGSLLPGRLCPRRAPLSRAGQRGPAPSRLRGGAAGPGCAPRAAGLCWGPAAGALRGQPWAPLSALREPLPRVGA